MRKAYIIVFEEDCYNSMFEAMFHDLQNDPDVYFVMERSCPNSAKYRYLRSKKLNKLTLGLSELVYRKTIWNYYKLPGLIRKLKREYDHVSVLFHNAALRKPRYPASFFITFRKWAALNLLYMDVHEHLYVCKEANALCDQGVFDKVFTIDPGDAEKYGMHLCRTPYSRIIEKEAPKPNKHLYFCGYEAGRAYILYNVWKQAGRHEVELAYDLGYAEQFKDFFEGDPNIHFTEHLAYEEVLKRELSSLCMLDITQKGQSALTLRPYEAVVYNKKLLTNNENIKQFKYYDGRYMKVFQKAEDIDWEWVKADIPVEYGYEGDFSPTHMLEELA